MKTNPDWPLLALSLVLALLGVGTMLLLTGCTAQPRPSSPIYPVPPPQIGATDSYIRPTK